MKKSLRNKGAYPPTQKLHHVQIIFSHTPTLFNSGVFIYAIGKKSGDIGKNKLKHHK